MSTIYYWLGLGLFWAIVGIISTIVGVLSIERLTRRSGVIYHFYEWHFRRKRLRGKMEAFLKVNWSFDDYCVQCGRVIRNRHPKFRDRLWGFVLEFYNESRIVKYPEWSGNLMEQAYAQDDKHLEDIARAKAQDIIDNEIGFEYDEE